MLCSSELVAILQNRILKVFHYSKKNSYKICINFAIFEMIFLHSKTLATTWLFGVLILKTLKLQQELNKTIII